jgi:nicotinamide-nucleotide amidase
MDYYLEKLANIVSKFTKKGFMIALAESCTGGYISHMITNISGASNVFERGIVCYSNRAKIDLLNVNERDLDEFGAVSEQVGRQLANNMRILSNVAFGIGITGIAGPTGGTPEKPVGLVYIGFSTKKQTRVNKYVFETDRLGFKKKVLEKIIEFLESKI